MNRDNYVEHYKKGFELGCKERHKQPEDRRQNLIDLVVSGEYLHDELQAMQSGYELGLKGGYPGADIDVEKKANSSYDRSEHSSGIDEWSQ